MYASDARCRGLVKRALRAGLANACSRSSGAFDFTGTCGYGSSPAASAATAA